MNENKKQIVKDASVIDVCNVCFLTDHHNRDGELMIGIDAFKQTEEEFINNVKSEIDSLDFYLYCSESKISGLYDEIDWESIPDYDEDIEDYSEHIIWIVFYYFELSDEIEQSWIKCSAIDYYGGILITFEDGKTLLIQSSDDKPEFLSSCASYNAEDVEYCSISEYYDLAE